LLRLLWGLLLLLLAVGMVQGFQRLLLDSLQQVQ
jgi:hypothetical protein